MGEHCYAAKAKTENGKESGLSHKRLIASRRQVSRGSPPNRTYTFQCIRLSIYPPYELIIIL